MSNAYLMNHSLSFSGGSDKNSFYVSLETQRTRGTAKDTEGPTASPTFPTFPTSTLTERRCPSAIT